MLLTDTGTVLSIKGLRKSYGALVAVKDLSLDVRRGEILGLLGPDGAGKTTIVHMVCGLLRSDAGAVFVDGRSLEDEYRECRQLIGHCPQDLIIWESLTCLEQLEFVGRQYELDRKAAWYRADESLEALGLSDERNRLASTLSDSKKRRLNIALALVHEPQLLILDEPQLGLDAHDRALVREYVRSLRNEMAVLLTTHDVDEADKLSDRIAIIDRGCLLELDTPNGLKSRVGAGDVLGIKISNGQEKKLDRMMGSLPECLRDLICQNGTLRLVASDTMGSLPTVFAELRKIGLDVEDVSIRKKTLEDVFLALTGRKLRE